MMNSSNGNSGNNHIPSNHLERIRVLIVDDQNMIKEGLKALINTEEDLEVVGTAENGEDAIKQVEYLQPDVVLMDMEMPEMDGVSATKIICDRFDNVKVLVLSTYDNKDYVSRSLSSGAMGYLLKGTPAKELTEAIRSVHRGYAQIGSEAYQAYRNNLPVNSTIKEVATNSATLTEPNDDSKISTNQTNGNLAVAAPSELDSKKGALAVGKKPSLPQKKFEQTVVLRQSPKWSRAIIWGIMGVTTFVIAWAYFAKIEQVVPAKGQLKPVGKVKEIQVPTNGVVKEVKVEDGQKVKKGDLLLQLDSTTAEAQKKSFNEILESLSQENKFYRALMSGEIEATKIEEAIAQLNIPREIAFLARNRAALIGENQYFQAQLGLSSGRLSPAQTSRLKASQAEFQSRAEAARLKVEELGKQLNQNEVELADTKAQLATGKQVREEILQRNRELMAQAEESLEIEKNILSSIKPLAQEGAVSRFQYDRQKQEVNNRLGTLVEQRSSGTIELNSQEQEIKTLEATIDKLEEEEVRLQLQKAQAQEELTNTTALSEKDIRDRLAENEKNIAEIDSQLNKTIVENDKRISENNSQMSGAEQTLKYQALYAPVSGTVFDLKAYPGYVPPAGQAAEPILKIVPDDTLIGEVFITTQDIGFVKEGMITDVRIDTFPFSEFGDVKGKVVSIASDALEPDQVYNYFRFPTKIELDQQFINIKGKDIPLKTGWSITANIKVRENRTVLSLLTEQFFTGLDKFKETR